MNKRIKKLTAAGLCAALCLGGTGFALAQTEKQQEQMASAKNDQTQDIAGEWEPVKDETVYVLAGADGTVQKIIVSDWLKNTSGSGKILDVSELSGIENVKGEESYTTDNGEGKIWNAGGNDIYYQGNTEKELPVKLTISYKLDGKTVSAQEMVGKSGKATIRFDYENCRYEMAEIDGREEKIFVPFVMLTGMLLDNTAFCNIEVTNGKLINDGDRTIVAGLAFPGWQETLGISRDTLEIPDYVEVTADVTEFSLGMTVTVATNEIFSGISGEKPDMFAGITESFGELAVAMTELMDGSNALSDGLCSLLEETKTLAAGVNQLADGAGALKQGADALDAGTAELSTGFTELSAGLSQLSAGSTGLNEGAEQVFQTLLASATTQLQAAGVPAPALTMDNYAEVLNGIIAAMGENTGKETEIVAALKASLDGYRDFYLGLCSYTEGVDSAAAGAVSLSAGVMAVKTGTAELKTGVAALYGGMLGMQEGIPALTDGVTQLRDGAAGLSNGLEELDEQGIRKLETFAEEKLTGLVTRLEAMVSASEAYNNFAGIGEDMAGQVRFIYRTEELSGR